jgi:hypothetical protein
LLQIPFQAEQSKSYETSLTASKEESTVLRDSLASSETRATEAETARSVLESRLTSANGELDAALSTKLELDAKLGSIADERKERCLHNFPKYNLFIVNKPLFPVRCTQEGLLGGSAAQAIRLKLVFFHTTMI